MWELDVEADPARRQWFARLGRPGWTAWVIAIVVGVVLLGSCASSTTESTGMSAAPGLPPSTSTPAAPGTPGAGAPPRLLLRSPEWVLKRAADLPADRLVSPVLPLSTAWYAEYDRAAPYSDVQRLKVSGIEEDLAEYVTLVTGVGFVLTPVETPFGAGWVGSTEESGSRPTVLAFTVDGSVVELLSYELSGDELLALAPDLQAASPEEWQVVVR